MIRSVESAIALLLTKVTKGANALNLKGWIDRLKNVQISYDLFLMLVKYHLGGDDIWSEDIDAGLKQKVEAVIARNTYTKYKTAVTKEEQEKARIEYLDLKGYHKDFRW
ncbi:hypothetical protein DSECCO2_157220 [anaerobic digester metagenome]